MNQNNSLVKYAAACLRRSSQEQKENNSFEIQRSVIKKCAEEKGYVLPDEYIFEDDGVSAYKKEAPKRKGLMQLRKHVLENPIDAVIFYDYSRMDRKGYSFVEHFYDVVKDKKPNTKFINASQSKEWSAYDFDVKIQFLLARLESDGKSRNATSSHTSALSAENKKRPGSKCPYGYDFIDKQLFPNEDAPIVLLIYHLASWGHSLKSIATLLNESNIPSPNAKKWSGQTIDHILNNKAYNGDLVWEINNYDKQTFFYENNHEPIVPKHLITTIESCNMLKKRYGKLDTPFLLSDLLHCKGCNSIINHRNASTKKYTYMKYYCKKCKYEFDAATLHDSIIGNIEKEIKQTFTHMEKPLLRELNKIASSLKEEKSG